MAGNKVSSIIEGEINAKLVFDLVYNPLETPLIHQARKQGIPFITGIEMFIQQGARQFEIFTGKPAPEEEMFRVVLHALKQQSEIASGMDAPEPAPRAKKSSDTQQPKTVLVKAVSAKTAKKSVRSK